jgi:K+-sensing histidine kinase KdpD
VKPRLDRTDITEVVVNLVEQYSRQCADRRFFVSKGARATEVLADSDLLQLALRQLLDNACKYSPPGSDVKVSSGTAERGSGRPCAEQRDCDSRARTNADF